MTEAGEKNKSLHDYKIAAPWNQDRVDSILKILNKRKDFKGSDADFSLDYEEGKILLEPEVYNRVPKVNPAWLKRYRKRFRECGISGLLSGHGKKGSRRLKEKHKAFILKHIFENPFIRSARIWEYLSNEYGNICNRRTVERFVRHWKKKHAQTYASLCNPAKAKSKFMASFGKANEGAKGYLDVVEIDATPGDVITSDGKRHKIIAAVDTFSTDACALVSDVSSDIANNALLHKLLTEKGIPGEIRCDNAKEYRSKYFRGICAEFDIRLPILPPGAPEKRPYVERYFGTLTIKLLPEIPGWCGRDVSQRQDIRERKRWNNLLKPGGEIEVPVSPQQFQIILNDFNEFIHRQAYNKGLRCAPVKRIAGANIKTVEDPRDLDILLAPRAQRTINKKGIFLDGGLFQSVELALHIGETVEVRQNLEDVSTIYVFDQDRRFITIARDVELAGLTIADYKEAKKLQSQQLRKEIKALRDLPSVEGTGMGALIAARKSGSQILPFIRHTKLEGNAVEEARKAVQAREQLEGTQEDMQAESAGGNGFYCGADYRSRHYESLMQKYQDGGELTEAEQKFIETFERSNEYFLLYQASGE